MTFEVRQGDCVELMAAMPACSVDSVVCDPPYGLEFMGKDWDRLSDDPVAKSWDSRGRTMNEAPAPSEFKAGVARGVKTPKDNPRCDNCGRAINGRATAKGFKVCECETPAPRLPSVSARKMQAWHEVWSREAFRVLKPGGHLLAFGGTRTYHRLVCAVEDAGFEIRDTIAYMYGSGFPKSLNVGKAIDKAARGVPQGGEDPTSAHHGQYRTTTTEGKRWDGDSGQGYGAGGSRFLATTASERTAQQNSAASADTSQPSTLDATASEWEGWGTALKPSHEPVVVARKPLSGTVAANCLEHGTGALNVDGCRVGTDGGGGNGLGSHYDRLGDTDPLVQHGEDVGGSLGRWPANVVLSHMEECVPVGTRKVKSSDARKGDGTKSAEMGETWREGSGLRPELSKSPATYNSADGTETVTAWRCHPGCPVRLLDEQTGEVGGGFGRRGAEAGGLQAPGSGWGTRNTGETVGFGDSGGASRFMKNVDWKHEETERRAFYCAKASRSERNAGLEGFEEQPAGGHVRSQDEGTYWEFVHPAPEGIGDWLREARETAGLSLKAVAAHFPSRTGGVTGCVTNWEREFNRPTPDQWRTLRRLLGFDDRFDVVMTEQFEVDRELFDDKPRQSARNVHPTVKPISLMRWLVRLVTPPLTPEGKPGLVLDPFCGSGSTGAACMLEGFDFLGLEQDAEYVRIAEARIAWWHKHRGDGEASDILAAGEARDEVEATGQLDMFG